MGGREKTSQSKERNFIHNCLLTIRRGDLTSFLKSPPSNGLTPCSWDAIQRMVAQAFDTQRIFNDFLGVSKKPIESYVWILRWLWPTSKQWRTQNNKSGWETPENRTWHHRFLQIPKYPSCGNHIFHWFMDPQFSSILGKQKTKPITHPISSSGIIS